MNETKFNNELLEGEKILWSGKPEEGILFKKADIFLIPFSLLWGGFTIFWEISVLRINAPLFFSLFGIPFVLFGLYLMIGRFFYKKHKKRNTYYAITDQRVLILTALKNKRLKSIFIKNIPTINKNIKSNGYGSIKFGNSSIFTSMYENTGLGIFGYENKNIIAFYDIREVNEVYKLVNNLKKAV